MQYQIPYGIWIKSDHIYNVWIWLWPHNLQTISTKHEGLALVMENPNPRDQPQESCQ